jgi:hypothetical protein
MQGKSVGIRINIQKVQRKLETFFASDRIYLSKGAAGHPLVKLA